MSLALTCRRLAQIQCARGSSSTTAFLRSWLSTGRNDEQDGEDDLSAWIPPDRPLSGDTTQNPAIMKNFEEDEDDLSGWIPPDRPLSGDTTQNLASETSLDEDEELAALERELQIETERQAQSATMPTSDGSVDWLQTRRSKTLEGVEMTTPELGSLKKLNDSDLPVIKHTLLTSEEIKSCLTAIGGKDITVISGLEKRLGGANGMVLVTASSTMQVKMLADTLVRQLKRRDLQDVGVIGAKLGAEGSDDKYDHWRVVDCDNYIVHFFLEQTRKDLNLEGLWTFGDASQTLDLTNENAIDDYVNANPVPESFGSQSTDWIGTISQMKRNMWVAPHRPVVAKKDRKRKKRRPRRS